jgi:2-keto-4-pentenoate hydratase/2-oxohepta-3-ene-1,7-dioic acid hydratase in catechol pathway
VDQQHGYRSGGSVLGVRPSPPDRPLYTVACDSNAIANPGSEIALAGHDIDYEGEIAVIIGAPAIAIPAARAWSVVAAVTAANDVTARDLQIVGMRAGDLSAGKLLPLSTPLGPGLLIAPTSLSLEVRVNGELRQQADGADMIHPVPDLIAAISRDHTLVPGDVIMTGSPAGNGHFSGAYLRHGDDVSVTVGPLPPLTNTFR